MELGVIHLEHTGAYIVRRLLAGGHRCVVFDPEPRLVAELAADKAFGAVSISDLVHEMDAPRAIWLTGPAAVAGATLAELGRRLEPGDIVVDCSDASFDEDRCRARALAARRVGYVDVAIKGRVSDLEARCCVMVGGDDAIVLHLHEVLSDLASGSNPAGRGIECAATQLPEYLHCGPAGTGHFVGAMYDRIQQALMAVYAEGFAALRAAAASGPPQHAYALDEIAAIWRHGSAVTSDLLDLVAPLLARFGGDAEVTERLADAGPLAAQRR